MLQIVRIEKNPNFNFQPTTTYESIDHVRVNMDGIPVGTMQLYASFHWISHAAYFIYHPV